MLSIHVRLSLVAAVLVLAGCASSGSDDSGRPRPRTETSRVTEPGPTTEEAVRVSTSSTVSGFTVGASVAATWSLVQEALEELGLGVTYIERAEWRLGAENLVVRRIDDERLSRYLRCGSSIAGPLADRSEVRITLHIDLRTTDNTETEVVTDFDGMARPRDTNRSAVHCTSSGRLEEKLRAIVHEKLLGRIGSG